MPIPRFPIRTLMIAVAMVGLLPISRALAADHPSKAPVPTVIYANLTAQADEDRYFKFVGVVCSVLYAVVALMPVCRCPMTTRRWMLAAVVVVAVIWIESSLYRWLSDEGAWPDRVWGMLQLPLGLVLGFAVFLWYAMKWLRSPVPPNPLPREDTPCPFPR